MVFLAVAIVIALVVAQALVTVRLWRSDLYTRSEKIAQSALVWLLPAGGSAIVYAALRQDDDVSRPTPNAPDGEGSYDMPVHPADLPPGE